MGIRTRRARTRSRTHIVSFSIAGFFGFVALFVMAMFLSVEALVTNWLSGLPDYSSANAYSLKEYKNLHRRMEILGNVDGATIMTDYGHHPVEIKAKIGRAHV